MPRRLPPFALALTLAALLAGGARAEEAPDAEAEPREGSAGNDDPAARLKALESWIVVEEEDAPEPPLLRLEVGFVGFISTRSRIQVDRNGLNGTPLDDLEEKQGLRSGGVGPWVELTLGAKVRGGVDYFEFSRSSERYVRQEQTIDFDGERLAGVGDYARANSDFRSMSGFVQWDALYGQTYRIGLIGGLRYFRFDVDLEAIRFGGGATTLRTRRVVGEMLSPYFGGQVELTPFPYFSVYTRVQFMNWSWSAVGLSEARYFQFRLGARVNLIPDTFSVGVEYRFIILRATPTVGETGRQIEGGLSASGVCVTLTFSF
ncbi:MAG: hypothetical protein AB7N76_20650 [Planctomycetota bacterium]